MVQAIPIAESDHNYIGAATISGWGSMSRTNQQFRASVLQKLDVTIITSAECNQLLKVYAPGFTQGVDNICARSDERGRSTCAGDSGGPLIQADENGDIVQIGVVSWGFSPCGFPFRPAIYSGVMQHNDFINDSIMKN